MTLSVSLSHGFGDFRLEAAFEAPPGVTALFGRSGSGKTTVVNAVAGLLRPQKGRVAVGDRVLLDTETRTFLPPHRRRIGYVFQDARLFPHLTVRQNLTYGGWFNGTDSADLPRIVDMLGIGPLLHRRPGALSGGERQRVALGRAILSAPHLLLMDEPLAALDEARKAEILPYLERLRDEVGLPILYVSHSMAEVARLATTVVLLEAGRVTAAGPVAEVLSDPGTAPGLGLREAGAVLQARIDAQEEADGLTRLVTSAGPLWLPRVQGAPGRSLRLRILAQDVMLALQPPQGISALNQLPCVVEAVQEDGPAALVKLRAGNEALLARVTRRSVRVMELRPGLHLHAILKAVSVAQENVGRATLPS